MFEEWTTNNGHDVLAKAYLWDNTREKVMVPLLTTESKEVRCGRSPVRFLDRFEFRRAGRILQAYRLGASGLADRFLYF